MKLLFSLFLTVCGISASAQVEEEKAIRHTIDQMFTGMRTSDTMLIASAFSPTAVMQTIVNKNDGSTVVRTETVGDFVKAVGKPRADILDERISFGSILIDGNMAAVWTPYEFYLGKTFSHCGVNSFQLVKMNGSWKIQYIIDTRRKEPCQAK